MEIMDETNPQNDLLQLRKRLLDLQRSQSLTPEAFGLYQQTILQLHQEADKRKQSCMQQAQTLRAQAAAVESQGHAFSSMASILFSVVNGYILLEEKRAAEEQAREQERKETAEPEPLPAPPPPGPTGLKKVGRPRRHDNVRTPTGDSSI